MVCYSFHTMIKSITRFVTLAALFLIPIFPLIVANSYFFPFITGKAFYFRILVEIAFLGWLVLAFADARYRPKINGMMIGVSVLALVALVADLVGVNPIRSLWSNFERMEGWITIAHLWMFYIATVGVFSFTSGSSPTEEAKRWWQRWMNAFLVIGFIVGCYGFAQLFGWTAIHQGSSRIDASLGNAAYMAVYMLMNIGFALYLFFVAREKSNSKPLQWLYGVLAVIFAFLLFETATRGTIIGLVGGTMLTLFLYAILAKSSSKKSRMICGGIVAFLVIAVIGIYALRSQPLIKNNDVLNRLTSISLSNSESTARLQIWGMALQGVKVRPILGWGQENFNYIFNYYYNPHMWMQEQWFDRAHSVFLDWLTASGIVGLLAYLALYVLAFMGVWKSDLSIAKKCVLIGFIAAYAIHNIFVFDNLASYVGFFAVLGFVGSGLTSPQPSPQMRGGGMPRNVGKNPVAFPPSSSEEGAGGRFLGGSREYSRDTVEYVILPASIVVLVAALYFLNVRAIEANTRLITALQSCNSPTPDVSLFEKVIATGAYLANQETREQAISCAGGIVGNAQAPNPTKQAAFSEAMKAIQDQIAAAPKDARMYVLGGQFLTGVGDNTEG